MNGYIHLSLEKRRQLEKMLNDNLSIQEIAKLLGMHNSTIYRELRRGMREGKYSADVAQEHYKMILAQKGKKPLIDSSLALIISKMILEEKMTTGQIIKRLELMGIPNRPKSVNTLYRAIDNGLIPNVTRDTLNQLITHTFSNGHIILPKWVIEKVNIANGTPVNITIEGNRVVLELIGKEHP